MDTKNITISTSQAKLVLKSLKEIEDRLGVVCRISDDSKEIKTAEKQLAELAKLIDDIKDQTKQTAKKSTTRSKQPA